MEKNIEPGSFEEIKNSLNQKLDREEAARINPLFLAWYGDGIFTDYIRKFLILNNRGNIGKLHTVSVKYVKAKAQSDMVHFLDDILTDEEREIVRKGRNTNSMIPKHATVSDYRYATGFEALIGWLKLTSQNERVVELVSKSIEHIKTAT